MPRSDRLSPGGKNPSRRWLSDASGVAVRSRCDSTAASGAEPPSQSSGHELCLLWEKRRGASRVEGLRDLRARLSEVSLEPVDRCGSSARQGHGIPEKVVAARNDFERPRTAKPRRLGASKVGRPENEHADSCVMGRAEDRDGCARACTHDTDATVVDVVDAVERIQRGPKVVDLLLERRIVGRSLALAVAGEVEEERNESQSPQCLGDRQDSRAVLTPPRPFAKTTAGRGPPVPA